MLLLRSVFARRIWVFAAFGILGVLLAGLLGVLVFDHLPVSTDEGSYLFQAHTLSEGRLVRPYPPMGSLIRRADDMLIMDTSVGWVSRYPPGHAIWLLGGVFLGSPRIMVLLACGLSIFVLMLVADQLKAAPFFVGCMLLLSPFFLLMHGTLLSHSSGFLAVSLLLFFYIRFRQTGCLRFGALAGLVWSLLFLNRTYTAVLVALPFAIDSLVLFAMRRDRETFRQTIVFGASSCCGLVAYMLYNGLITGNPLTPTYLLYDATQTLGFGMRHLKGLAVEHSFGRGLANTWINLVTLDDWLIGVRFGLIVFLVLALLGWQKRWGGLLWGGLLCLIAGYVFFWFPGPRHIGPAYYFEGLPFLLMLAAIGFKRASDWAAQWRGSNSHYACQPAEIPAEAGTTSAFSLDFAVFVVPPLGGRVHNGNCWWRGVGVGSLVVAGVMLVIGSIHFVAQQQSYFRGALASQRALSDALSSAPPDALVFLRNIKYPPFGKIAINLAGVASDPLVLSCPGPEHYGEILAHFPERTAYWIDGRSGMKLEEVTELEETSTAPIGVDAHHLHHFTGENEKDAEKGLLRVAREGRDEAQYLAYGFRRMLPPGNYVATFRIVSSVGTEDSTGRLDVSTDLGRIRLAEAPIPDVDSSQRVVLAFTVSGKDFMKVEPRVYYGGAGDISLQSISIKRLDS